MAEETTTETSVTETTTTEPTDVEKLKKALEAERAGRRDAERSRKAADSELEKLRTASLSETEKAIAEAKAAGRTEALAETGKRLAAAELRAAAAAAGLDVAEVLDLVDLTRFVGEDGNPDEKAIAEAVTKFAGLRGEPAVTTRPGLDLGPRASAMPLNGDPILGALKSKLGIQ
jgi:hypothetical protein